MRKILILSALSLLFIAKTSHASCWGGIKPSYFHFGEYDTVLGHAQSYVRTNNDMMFQVEKTVVRPYVLYLSYSLECLGVQGTNLSELPTDCVFFLHTSLEDSLSCKCDKEGCKNYYK